MLSDLNETSEPDITGMALQALAKYQDKPAVEKAIDEALEAMSQKQNEKGGFSSGGTGNSESDVQMIVGLGELGISLDDPRFVKEGSTILDSLMSFHQKGSGFLHTLAGGGSNQIASEQGFYGVVAAQRLRKGKNSLYCMGDAKKAIKEEINEEAGEEVSKLTETGLSDKHKDIVSIPVTAPGHSFDDINNHKNKAAIIELASRKIINGKTETSFEPNATVTRAEFATIIINSLGLKPATNNKFTDVLASTWYAPYVGAANSYGIVGGVSEAKFNPNGTITKEEAASMITRAAGLSGLDTKTDDTTTRDVLAQFTDYVTSAEWARPALAFAYGENILDQSDLEINSKAAMTRGEIAQMVVNMLELAKLL